MQKSTVKIFPYNSKKYLFKTVSCSTEEVTKFEIIPFTADSSGDLTASLYKSESKEKEGLIFGFYGNYWNKAGLVYQEYSFKNFDKKAATAFLNKIQNTINENNKYLNNNNDKNNIYLRCEFIDVFIWSFSQDYILRLFWKGSVSFSEKTAFDGSKIRFEKKINQLRI